MADDLAFLFDDPVSGRVRKAPSAGDTIAPLAAPQAAPRLPDQLDWRTLRQAHDQTSIPVSTLRKWAKKGKVRARLVRTEGKELRLVAFGDVLERARSLDRAIEPMPSPAPDSPAVSGQRSLPSSDARLIAPVSKVASASTVHREAEQPAPVTEPSPITEAVAGVVSEEEPADEEPAVDVSKAETPATERSAAAVPEGSILVPLDAWDRLLGQLGNLHEAGQQLADARERAAKAETEAEFLRERLREMRKRIDDAELALDLHDHRPPEPPPPVAGWRRWRSRWLGY
jgi:hypothetical protein